MVISRNYLTFGGRLMSLDCLGKCEAGRRGAGTTDHEVSWWHALDRTCQRLGRNGEISGRVTRCGDTARRVVTPATDHLIWCHIPWCIMGYISRRKEYLLDTLGLDLDHGATYYFKSLFILSNFSPVCFERWIRTCYSCSLE